MQLVRVWEVDGVYLGVRGQPSASRFSCGSNWDREQRVMFTPVVVGEVALLVWRRKGGCVELLPRKKRAFVSV